jgi:hypothetical protein
MLHSDLRRSAEVCLTRYGVLGLSVSVADIRRLEELIPRARQAVQRYPNLSVCSLAVIEDATYPVVPTFEAPHYTVILPSVDSSDLDTLRQCFLTIPNPLYKPASYAGVLTPIE